jgi:UDP-N-acetyl-D-glucosamine dehydrogenase
VRFIELAGEINHSMPYFVRDKVARALNEAGLALRGADIFVLGIAYKKDIEDWRESPAIKVMELLHKDGARIDYHDPYVSKFADRALQWHSIPLSKERLERADCVLILTNHSNVDYARVVREAKLVIDTRNATKNVTEGREKVVLL